MILNMIPLRSKRAFSAGSIAACIAFVCVSVFGSVAGATDYSIYIVSGQSNAVGYDTNALDLVADPVDANIPFFFDAGDLWFDDGVNDSSSGGVWTTLGAQPKGVSGNFRYADGGFGPEIVIARDLYKAGIPNVAAFKFAYNSSGFAGNHWNKGDPLYDDMLARFNSAKALLEDGGANTVTLKGLFWLQGETDDANTYVQNFSNFIADVRNDYGVGDLPVFSGVFVDNPAFAGVVSAHQAVAAADPNVYYVDTSGASSVYGVHFTSTGMLDVGGRYANSYLVNIPEPATLSVMVLGSLSLLRRRRRNLS